jgi:hypothetical protein
MATPVSAEIPQSQFYEWAVPEKQISVQLSFEIMAALNREALKSLGAARGGAENGGVLLGKKRAEPDGRRTVTIEDFRPVPCSHERGPSYGLSDAEKKALEELLAKPPAEVVGYYRSHTRKGLFLSAEDLALCSAYFAGPANVFLLIKPFATRPCVGGFFFWESGTIHSEAPYQEFPFEQSGWGERVLEAEPDRPAEAVADEAPEVVLPPPRRSRWFWMGLAALLLLIAGGAAFTILRISKSRTETADANAVARALNLSVTDTGKELQVTWNRQSMPVLAAERAVLTIIDGDFRKDLDFDKEQVQNASVLYVRITGDVTFRLEVFSSAQTSTTDVVRFVTAAPAPPVAPLPMAEAPKPLSRPQPPPPSPAALSRMLQMQAPEKLPAESQPK